MNRTTAIVTGAGLLMLAATLTAPGAGAFPIRDHTAPCAQDAALKPVALLAGRYAKYLDPADLSAGDRNANGLVCVRQPAGTAPSTIGPVAFVDDIVW